MTRIPLSLPLIFALASTHATALPDKFETPLIVAASVEQSSSAMLTTADQIYRGSASHMRTHFWATTHVRARSCNAAGCGSWSMPISVPPTSWGICN